TSTGPASNNSCPTAASASKTKSTAPTASPRTSPARRSLALEGRDFLTRIHADRKKKGKRTGPRSRPEVAGASVSAGPFFWSVFSRGQNHRSIPQPGALGGKGGVLGGPVGQALAFLFDHGGRGVVDEGLVAQLGLAFADFGGDALEFLVQARALGAEVDQTLQRDQQLERADHGRSRHRRLALDPLDRIQAGQKLQRRRVPDDALAVGRLAVLQAQRHRLRGRDAHLAADRTHLADRRLQPLDAGGGLGLVEAGLDRRPGL